jgi:hypothetical protein
MYYQNTNDAWETWAFAWTLIPGFVGVGTILSQALDGNFRQGLRDGGRLIVISLIMFIIFGSIFGEFGSLSFAWAIGLIALGLWILVRNLILDRKVEKEKSKEEQVSDS